MKRSRWIVALWVALLLPSVVLTVTGVRSLRQGWKQIDESFRRRADAALESIEASLATVLEDVRQGRAPGTPVSFDESGPDSSAPEQEVPDPDALALWLSVADEIDRQELAGEHERALQRLAELLRNEPVAALGAWALTASSAIALRHGEPQWRAPLERLIAEYPDQRDGRGLKRAHAARFELATAGALEPADRDAALAALYAALCDDHTRTEQYAVASLKQRVAEELARSGYAGGDFAASHERDRTSGRELRQRAALLESPELTAWLNAGAEGGSRAFDTPRDAFESAGRWIVCVAPAPEPSIAGRTGGAVPLARVLEHALQSPDVRALEALGFAAQVSSLHAPDENAAAAGDTTEQLAQSALAPPFDGVSVSVLGADLTELRARERRSLWVWAVLIATALAVASFAAWATWRAVGAELEAARGREAFVAAVTHELKTPLGSIRLLAEVLERGDVEPDKVREFGQRTVREADRLARLVDSVLEWSRIAQIGQTAPLGPTDLNEVAARAAESFEPQARDAGAQVVVRPSEHAVRVLGDAPALEGAVLNLLDNARKYSDAPHEIELWVTLRAGDRARIDVLDRGHGVPADQAQRIFEPFRRAGDELTRERPGVGLGLALVHRISVAHGGRAIYTPREGGGSCFSIELPLNDSGWPSEPDDEGLEPS